MFDLKTRILVVDDTLAMRKIVTKTCKELGFNDLTEAADGNAAWDALVKAESPIELIISDWNMPNCSGLEFLKKVREDSRFKRTPFLMVTAEGEAHQVSQAVAAGVDNYVIKPFNSEVLVKKLEGVYAKRHPAGG